MLTPTSGTNASAKGWKTDQGSNPLDSLVSHALRRFVSSVFLAASLLQMEPSSFHVAIADTGWNGSRLQPCPYESNCVSSNYLEPPNRYLSPLQSQRPKEAAFASAVRDLSTTSTPGISLVESSPKTFYIHLTVPGTAPNSLDDVELVFFDDDGAGSALGGGSLVNLRCQSRVTLPPPPFCLKKNCINGNMDQRQRVDQIAQKVLGIPKADQTRMNDSAKWTPIFFNSDKVPGFDDELDY